VSVAEPLLFEGLKVVDAASWIAGPVAATILADLGADVIKVEMPGTGDPYRRLPAGPAAPKADVNYTWLMDARNKRSITLNVKSEAGRDVLKRLVQWCDVYVTNYPIGMRRSLGLTYEDLAPLNERMIFASLTAYGEVGPEAEREGFDGVAYWARSGLQDMVRAPGAPPAASVAGQGDHPTAVALYAAIVTALYRRQLTGKGTLVHTSLLANGFWSNGCMGQAALCGADFSVRRAAQARMAAAGAFTRAPFPAADGRFLQLNMVRSDEEQRALLVAIGLGALLDDQRFAEPETRLANAGTLADIVGERIRERTAADWLRTLGGAGVPAGLVASVDDMRTDTQAILNRVIVPPADPRVAAPYVINHPVRVEGIGSRGPTRAPDVGEHTDEVLRMLGFGDAGIAALRERDAL
jgi:crotonobetainyl-CoA:carnitine CoA-transferase CaiB-like acyl-CoA transferase